MPTLSLGSLGIPFNVTIEKATPKKWTPDLIKRFISVRERVFTAQTKQLKEYFKADSDLEAKIFNMNNVLTKQVLTERKDAMAKEIAEAMAEHFQMPVDNGDWYEISWRIQKPDWTRPSLRRAELSIRMVALREGLPVLIPGDKRPVVEFDYPEKRGSAPKPYGPPQGPPGMPGDSYDQNSNLESGSLHSEQDGALVLRARKPPCQSPHRFVSFAYPNGVKMELSRWLFSFRLLTNISRAGSVPVRFCTGADYRIDPVTGTETM
ncbi:hypothetical protein HD553DRAFT_321979 [Filobasidium floriforme]|uniref:uncharacterized protein n=1 Tax=Filobasidium floriforme TaxID=5210 RepID=UPI001E8D76E8|nr:uncharacterized protein HD553DRAFT_321979 [Filobasidium floriforme]KAH8089116.1 hypothetical protein HD553DRAFT_321979 [Filobasidium floriforme]